MGACSHKGISRRIYRATARPRWSEAKSRKALREIKYNCIERYLCSNVRDPGAVRQPGFFCLYIDDQEPQKLRAAKQPYVIPDGLKNAKVIEAHEGETFSCDVKADLRGMPKVTWM